MTELQLLALTAAGLAGAVVVGLGALEAFRRRMLTLHDPALVIVPPVYRFEGHDEDLRKRTEARRRAADTLKRQAATVEAGGHVGPVDVLVPGRRRA